MSAHSRNRARWLARILAHHEFWTGLGVGLIVLVLAWALPPMAGWVGEHLGIRTTETTVITVGGARGIDADVAVALEGHCWWDSLATGGRPGTYRCMSDHQIFDPCFQVAGQDHLNSANPTDWIYVACLHDPAERPTVIRADMTPYRESGASRSDLRLRQTGNLGPESRLWRFSTTDGLECSRGTGTVPSSAFGVAPFWCTQDTQQPNGGSWRRRIPSLGEGAKSWAFACYEPDPSKPVWTTRCVDTSRTSEEKTHKIRLAWY